MRGCEQLLYLLYQQSYETKIRLFQEDKHCPHQIHWESSWKSHIHQGKSWDKNHLIKGIGKGKDSAYFKALNCPML